ncbi:MAG: hypothetical protein V3V74_07380 [Nitrosomonadaceae bacterium]
MSAFNSKQVYGAGWKTEGTVSNFRIVGNVGKAFKIQNEAGTFAVLSFSAEDLQQIMKVAKKELK